ELQLQMLAKQMVIEFVRGAHVVNPLHRDPFGKLAFFASRSGWNIKPGGVFLSVIPEWPVGGDNYVSLGNILPLPRVGYRRRRLGHGPEPLTTRIPVIAFTRPRGTAIARKSRAFIYPEMHRDVLAEVDPVDTAHGLVVWFLFGCWFVTCFRRGLGEV